MNAGDVNEIVFQFYEGCWRFFFSIDNTLKYLRDSFILHYGNSDQSATCMRDLVLLSEFLNPKLSSVMTGQVYQKGYLDLCYGQSLRGIHLIGWRQAFPIHFCE